MNIMHMNFEKSRVEAQHQSATPPTVKYNDVFRLTGQYRRTVYRNDTNSYAAIFRFRGKWDGRRFQQDFVFRLTRSGWKEVHRYQIEWLS